MLEKLEDELFEGLKALSESAFPKRCSYCGRTFETAEEFIRETEQLVQSSGLKTGFDDDDHEVVELYRNCVCGSTLMDFFTDRRDTSERGLKRREHFERLMEKLQARGLSTEEARTELLNLMRGNPSPTLEKLGLRTKKN